MQKFDMGAAWDDATGLVRAHLPLTGVLVGLFLFLPGMAMALLGPVPTTAPPNVSPEQGIAIMSAEIRRQLPWLLGTMVASTIGSVAILRLWLARSGTSVGEALAFSLSMIPTLLVLFVVQSLFVGIAAIFLIFPAIYLMGRFAAVYPLMTDRSLRNPISALSESWELTKGNGWIVALYLLLFLVIALVVSAIIGGFASVLGAPGSAGYLIGSVINSALAAGVGLLNTAVAASVYRQLAVRYSKDTFI